MGALRIALLQMTADGTDQHANLHKGLAFCRRAKALGADIALFPEMWNIGYTRMANYAEPQQNGRSVAFGADGDLLLQADQAEGIYLADLDLDEVRAYRAKTIWGNAFRRPHRYALLCSPQVGQPFVRRNADGEPFDGDRR